MGIKLPSPGTTREPDSRKQEGEIMHQPARVNATAGNRRTPYPPPASYGLASKPARLILPP